MTQTQTQVADFLQLSTLDNKQFRFFFFGHVLESVRHLSPSGT